jgi:hypothetical protein
MTMELDGSWAIETVVNLSAIMIHENITKVSLIRRFFMGGFA